MRSLVLSIFLLAPMLHAQQAGWIVRNGYALETAAFGFMAPTGLAFIPHPGDDPDSPYYLVSELRGSVRGVTRSGNVFTFGYVEQNLPVRGELPNLPGEIGQIAACFDPEGQRFYTTSAVRDEGRLSNRVFLWEKDGVDEWRRGKIVKILKEPFLKDAVAGAHQIGQCRFGSDGKLYIGVGDAVEFRRSHNLELGNGKILRINPDFSPPADNPFPDGPGARPYVYASGLRNPFGVAPTPQGALYVADNGPSKDRLVFITKGKDVFWDGTDKAMLATTILPEGNNNRNRLEPADALYIPDGKLFPELAGHVLVTVSKAAQLIAIPVDQAGHVVGPIKELIRFKTWNAQQYFTGLALGPDGIYINHLRVEREGGLLPSAVFRLRPSADKIINVRVADTDVMEKSGCRGCHSIAGHGGTAGPDLGGVTTRIYEKILQPHYLKSLSHLKGIYSSQEIAEIEKRVAVMVDADVDLLSRAELWVKTKIEFPAFEMGTSSMPIQPVSEMDREIIAKAIVMATPQKEPPPPSFGKRLRAFIQLQWRLCLAICFLLGLGTGILGTRFIYRRRG